MGPPHLSLKNSFFSEYFVVFFTYLFSSFLNKIQKYQLWVTEINVNTKDKQVYVTTKKLSEKTEQNPCEPQPHWSNNILGSPSLSNPFWSLSVRGHSHIQVATRNVQWISQGPEVPGPGPIFTPCRVVFLIHSKVLLFHIAYIMYSYYKLNVLTLVIYRFITCATEYSQKIL